MDKGELGGSARLGLVGWPSGADGLLGRSPWGVLLFLYLFVFCFYFFYFIYFIFCLNHFKIFRQFLKMSFLHNNYLGI